MSTPKSEDLEEILRLKGAGNKLFSEHKLVDAITVWSEAVCGLPSEASDCDGQQLVEKCKLHCNMAEACLRLEKWEAVLCHATEALRCDESCVKALYRRARAHEQLQSYKSASVDLERALVTDPRNLAVKQLLKRVSELEIDSHEPKADDIELKRPSTSASLKPVGNRKKRRTRRKKKKKSEGGQTVPPRAEDSNHSFSALSPSGWAHGLSPQKRYEWLVDCYRMRLDDDAMRGYLRGLYDRDVDTNFRLHVMHEFLVFSKLAVAREAIPKNWNWLSFLRTAEKLLLYAFEKSDAQDKYGMENVFLAAIGGRSLRLTAELIYGTSICDFDEDELYQRISQEVREFTEDSDSSDLDSEWDDQPPAEVTLFNEVGGSELWTEFATLFCLEEEVQELLDGDFFKVWTDRNRAKPKKNSAGSVSDLPTSSAVKASIWARGLSQQERYEWLVDCYRLRVEDDAGNGHRRGLYESADSVDTPLNIFMDFLAFLKLAIHRGALPEKKWSWQALLDVAEKFLPHPFTNSDAQEKYGREEEEKTTDHRSLRGTAELIYGGSSGKSPHEGPDAVDYRKLVKLCWAVGDDEELENLFRDLGGLDLWVELHEDLGVSEESHENLLRSLE